MATQSADAKMAGKTAKSKTGELFTKLKGSAPVAFMKAHPYQSAGLGILGGANVAGLFDNDKVGGQLGGAALGALADIPLHALAGTTGVNLAWAPMVGGAIGSLFDKAREAKANQKQAEQMMQYRNLYQNQYA